LDFEGLDGSLQLGDKFELSSSDGFTLLEFNISIVAKAVSLFKEFTVSGDLAVGFKGDGGFLFNDATESSNVFSGEVKLVVESGNDVDEVSLGFFEGG